MEVFSDFIKMNGKYKKMAALVSTAYTCSTQVKAIHASITVHEHTKRGVVAQVHFCESSHP